MRLGLVASLAVLLACAHAPASGTTSASDRLRRFDPDCDIMAGDYARSRHRKMVPALQRERR